MSVLAVAGLVLLGTAATVLSALVLLSGLAARKAERLVPASGTMAVVEGIRLHYLDEGAGPEIVMIHGLGSQLQNWTYGLAARLRASHRLLMIDRPGSGYSQAGRSATLGAQARIIAGLMDRLGIERALVVGHSLGGTIALALAIEHPEKVVGLALIAPATQAVDAPPSSLRPLLVRSNLMRWIIGWTVAIPASARSRRRTLDALFSPDPVPIDFGTRGGALLAVRPWTFRSACRDMVEAGSQLGAYAARYGEIKVPVGVLFGDGDHILDHGIHGEPLRGQMADLDLQVVAEAGHMAPLVRPDEVAALIRSVAAKAGIGSDPTRWMDPRQS